MTRTLVIVPPETSASPRRAAEALRVVRRPWAQGTGEGFFESLGIVTDRGVRLQPAVARRACRCGRWAAGLLTPAHRRPEIMPMAVVTVAVRGATVNGTRSAASMLDAQDRRWPSGAGTYSVDAWPASLTGTDVAADALAAADR